MFIEFLSIKSLFNFLNEIFCYLFKKKNNNDHDSLKEQGTMLPTKKALNEEMLSF